MSMRGALDPGNVSEALGLQNGEYVRLLSLVGDASSSWPGGKLSLAFLCMVRIYYSRAVS